MGKKTFTDLRARDVILDKLRDDVDVVSPPCEAIYGLVDTSPSTLNNERSVFAQNVVQLEVFH